MKRTILIGLAPSCAGAADVPQRIVSLSPDLTEILYGMGAFNHVVAFSNTARTLRKPPSSPSRRLARSEPGKTDGAASRTWWLWTTGRLRLWKPT